MLPDAVSGRKVNLEVLPSSPAGTEKDLAHRWFLVCQALGDYRAEQYAAAIKWINRAAPNPNGGSLDATAYFVLAMVEHRRGRPAEARQALARAQAIRARDWLQVAEIRRLGVDWHDWLRCEVLRREAEGLIDPHR
jgi:Flp pilus assembly protein TadD